MKSNSVITIVALLILLALAVLYVLVFDVGNKACWQFIRSCDYVVSRIHSPLHSPQPLGIGDAGTIQSWMTFDYINKVYHLPENYLQTTFGVSDSQYPALTLQMYALGKGINPVLFDSTVQSAVRIYLRGNAQ